MSRSPEYKAGYSSFADGPNLDNCSILHFSTPGKLLQWEKGREAAIKKRMRQLDPKKREHQLELGALKTLLKE